MTSDKVTDVLVIGGGLAAISAAIAAAEAGAAVIVANKGVTGTAGSSAKAAGILAAPFGHGGLDGQPVDDSPARHAADSLAVGHHLGVDAIRARLAIARASGRASGALLARRSAIACTAGGERDTQSQALPTQRRAHFFPSACAHGNILRELCGMRWPSM